MWKASLYAVALLTMTMAGSLCTEDPASFPSIRPQTDGTQVRAKAHFRHSRNPSRQMLPAVEAWLSAEFDLPTIREHPLLRFVPAAKIAALRFRGLLSPPGTGFAANDQKTAFAQGDTLALYDDATHTIYLPEDWKGSTPFELSLLVHEMVHHFQNVLGLKHECPQQREKLAYVAQDHWLGLFGQSLADDFGLDAFSLLVKTTCFY